jgi:hypothetical protein
MNRHDATFQRLLAIPQDPAIMARTIARLQREPRWRTVTAEELAALRPYLNRSHFQPDGGSLHCVEDRAEINGSTYRLVYALNHEGEPPWEEVEILIDGELGVSAP